MRLGPRSTAEHGVPSSVSYPSTDVTNGPQGPFRTPRRKARRRVIPPGAGTDLVQDQEFTRVMPHTADFVVPSRVVQSEGSQQIVIETYVIDSLFLAFTGDPDDCDRRPPRCGSECLRTFITLDSHRANLDHSELDLMEAARRSASSRFSGVDRMSRMLQEQS